MSETLFLTMQPSFDPEGKVRILRSSKDPEVGRFLEWAGATGSTGLDNDGKICILLNDARGIDKLTWLEECGHALQLLKHDSIKLGLYSQDELEVEVISCLITNSRKLRLTPSELLDCEKRLEYYGNNNGR